MRSWRALAQWEGVVYQVGDGGFRAKLTPLVNGRPDPTRVQFAEFAFDELAYDGDRDLVVEDAVFYWTVGRKTDEHGTRENSSFIRFRRVPPPSTYRQKLAAQEARELLGDQGDR